MLRKLTMVRNPSNTFEKLYNVYRTVKDDCFFMKAFEELVENLEEAT